MTFNIIISHIFPLVRVNLAGKGDFTALKAEVENWLENLKTEALVGKLKTVFLDLVKLSEVVGKETVKKKMYGKVTMKVNNSENKVPMRLL